MVIEKISALLTLILAASPLAAPIQNAPDSSVIGQTTGSSEVNEAAFGVDILSAATAERFDDNALENTTVLEPAAFFLKDNAVVTSTVDLGSDEPEPTITDPEPGVTLSDTGYELLTSPLASEEFQVAGVTWSGATPATIDIRTEVNSEWSEWYRLELEDSEDGGTPGTEPFMSAGATGAQVRATGTTLPDSLNLMLMTGAENTETEVWIDPEISDVAPPAETNTDEAINADDVAAVSSDVVTDQISLGQSRFFTDYGIDTAKTNLLTPSVVSAAVPAPNIRSRAQWDAPTASWTPVYVDLKGAIIHHTAGQNEYTEAQAPGIVRGIYDYHANRLGWGDIGYNFLIDKYGNIYEGRTGSLNAPAGKMVIGGHARPANTNSVGISVLGTYMDSVTPSTTVLNAIESIIAWQFSRSGVSPSGTWVHGGGSSISTIAGHKEVAATACPGTIQNHMGSIQTNVASLMSGQVATWKYMTGAGGQGWYYVDATGTPYKGWRQIGGEWYYLDPSTGLMRAGWQEINEAWYYLGVDGAMRTNWYKHGDNWYYLGVDGAMRTGWLKLSNKWYHFSPNGQMHTKWTLIDDHWYYLDPVSGVMSTGWFEYLNRWYFLDFDGAMRTGWLLSYNNWYHLNSHGQMETGIQRVNGEDYYLDPTGKLATGWISFLDNKYYAEDNGELISGWHQLDNSWYYFNNDKAMVTDWLHLDGESYWFWASGKMAIGLRWIAGELYYFDTTGRMTEGWVSTNGKWYYGTQDGTLARGWHKVDNKWYHFGTDWVMNTGWLVDKDVWYYLNPKGNMAVGWQQVNGTWYYFRSTGQMGTGWLYSNSKWYYLADSGAMVTGVQRIDGKTYTFDQNGVLKY
ncbi:MAG: hypothetical protein GX483_07595 [Actinomycetaceae bacterium]|nr:hypothetical protein [Actinomycetaceae bacterium]